MTDDDTEEMRRLLEANLPEQYRSDPDAPTSGQILREHFKTPHERADLRASMPCYQREILDRITRVTVLDNGAVEFEFVPRGVYFTKRRRP